MIWPECTASNPNPKRHRRLIPRLESSEKQPPSTYSECLCSEPQGSSAPGTQPSPLQPQSRGSWGRSPSSLQPWNTNGGRSSGSHRSCHQWTQRFTVQSRKMRKPVNFRIGQYLGERPINLMTWDLICLWVNTFKESAPFKKYSWTVDRHPSLSHHQNSLNWVTDNMFGKFRNQKSKVNWRISPWDISSVFLVLIFRVWLYGGGKKWNDIPWERR